MDDFRSSCDGCPGRLVCHCLQVTEDALLSALTTLQLRTVKEVRAHTGAGDGCTACHRRLKKYLDAVQSSSSPAPICSVR